MLTPGAKVQLKSFNNTSTSPEGCEAGENYWLLIGHTGIILKPENKRHRALVKFNTSVEELGLHCHNEVENSLLILTSDLEVTDV